MSNGSKSTKQEDEELTFAERLELIKAIQGIANGQQDVSPDDEQYAIFTAGDHADQEFRRIAKPPQSKAREVAKLRVQYSMISDSVKETICSEWGWDPEEKCSDKLSRFVFQKKVLPLICRDLPEEYDFDNTNGAEIDRMLHDFLLGT